MNGICECVVGVVCHECERAKASEVRFLGDLQRLEIKPGDKFVLKCDDFMTRDAMDCIQAAWKRFAGDAPLLVLERGMSLGAISMNPDE